MYGNGYGSGSSGLNEGIVISIFEDVGPSNIFNSSPLSDIEALNLAVKGMTLLGTDTPLAWNEIRSCGPMPTPKDPYITIGFIFTIKAHSTEDSRISNYGRLVVIWVISRSNSILKYTGVIKQMIQRLLRTYRIDFDVDIKKEDILKKLDEKLKIVETGVESYYITKDNKLESFMNIAIVPKKAPVVLINNNKKIIELLIPDNPSPVEKIKYLNLVNDFKEKIPKSSLYKVEAITENITIQQKLSKEGFMTPQSLGDHFRIRLTDDITFEEINEALEKYFIEFQNKLANLIFQVFQKEKELNLTYISTETGLSKNLIKELITELQNTNVIPQITIIDN